jgi:hypothetical protein
MAFNFGIQKDFCIFLTRRGNCRKSDRKCPYTQIPSPSQNTKEKWEDTLKYLKTVYCYNGKNEIIEKWLKKVKFNIFNKLKGGENYIL